MMRSAAFLLDDWLLKCRGARIDLDHSGMPSPYSEGFDPQIDDADLDGLELEEQLKALLAKQYGAKRSNVALATGAQHANFLFFGACFCREDRVAVESPTYSPLVSAAEVFTREVLPMEREKDAGFDIGRLGLAFDAGAKGLAMTNLHNPSGRQLGDREVKAIVELAQERGALVLSDEIFREMSYSKPSRPAASFEDNAVSTCGMTKFWGLGEVRVGWLVGSEEVVDKVNLLRIYSNHRVPARSAAITIEALKRKDWFRERVLRLAQGNLRILDEWAEKEKRLSFRRPDGGLLVLMRLPKGMDDEEFAIRLFKRYKTAVCPGRYFLAEGCIRATFSCGNEAFAEGLEQISAVMDQMTS